MSTMNPVFRSAEMSLTQLFIQADEGRTIVTLLGKLGLCHFLDANSSTSLHQRPFMNQVRECEKIEKQLRFLKTLALQFSNSTRLSIEERNDLVEKLNSKLSPLQVNSLSEETWEGSSLFTEQIRTFSRPQVEKTFETIIIYGQQAQEISQNEEVLTINYLEIEEFKQVLSFFGDFLSKSEAHEILTNWSSDDDESEVEEVNWMERTPEINLSPNTKPQSKRSEINLVSKFSKSTQKERGFITGVVPRENLSTFEVVLWRSFRGNIFLKFSDLEDSLIDSTSTSTSKIEKCAFIVFAHGSGILVKVQQICQSFGTLYPCPQASDQIAKLQEELQERLNDMEKVMKQTHLHQQKFFFEIRDNFSVWEALTKQEKIIHHTMNLFDWDVTSKCLIAEAWCPTEEIPTIKQHLLAAAQSSQSHVPTVLNILDTKLTPPTYHRTNEFTHPFQVIIDMYGVANYREMNPAPFSIITFPFLFGVMFGDFGHGFLMTLVALFLIYKAKQYLKINNEIMQMLVQGRYIILLMGLFSIYSGLIYNDIFSLTVAIFGKSGWEFEQVSNSTYVGTFNGNVYPFGLDYAWHGADNNLLFTNSYKMKMSVIFGIFHMTFGLVLSLMNHINFKKKLNIWNEFVPRMIFLQSIFGYLVFTIIFKWCSNWDDARPPDLLNMLIYFFLSPGKIAKNEYLYPNQGTVQIILLTIALISVPWMLLVKPFYLRSKQKTNYQPLDHDEEEFNFGEIMIEQVIHTIDFCLGSISNTASYLRLWALSLAHAQLSAVLWKMTFTTVYQLNMGNMTGLGLFYAFSTWFGLTLFILLLIEGLSAFLHVLRLHWVEFNNKFYGGSGYSFVPFSLAKLQDEE